MKNTFQIWNRDCSGFGRFIEMPLPTEMETLRGIDNFGDLYLNKFLVLVLFLPFAFRVFFFFFLNK